MGALLIGSTATAQAATLRGVQLESFTFETSSADIATRLDHAQALGATAIRIDVNWSSLESGGPGQHSPWYVEDLDQLMAGASARGMRVIATMWATPCWASSAPDSLKQGCAGAWWSRGVTAYAPSSPADYANAAAWVAARYSSSLAAIEIWNEPDQGTRFWVSANPAADYAALVRATYGPVKAAAPSVTVLVGATAAADKPFLDALYANGIKGHEDGVSVHPYNEARAPSVPAPAGDGRYSMLSGLAAMHASQLAAGDSTPIWVTEFGWTTATGSSWQVTPAQQAQNVVAGAAALEGLDYVAADVVYELRNVGTDPGDFESNFGLLNHDWSPKPAFAALQAAWTASAASTSGPTVPGASSPRPAPADSVPVSSGPAARGARSARRVATAAGDLRLRCASLPRRALARRGSRCRSARRQARTSAH